MSEIALLAVTGAVLFGLWQLLSFTFEMIERSRPLRGGAKPVREREP